MSERWLPGDGPERRFLACLALACLAAVACGGASVGAPIRLALVELCALPVLGLALLKEPTVRVDLGTGVLTLIAALPLLQLIPLPPAIWRYLAGGAARAEAFAAAGASPVWAPVSLEPRATLDCALALVAPAAVFLATSRLTRKGRRRLAALWLAAAVAGLGIGALQLAQPDGGWAYPYTLTNLGSLVGLFANRNHQAAWLLTLIPISTAVAAPGLRDSRLVKNLGPALIAALFPAFALIALGAVRSRAGVLLAAPAIFGALAVLAAGRVPWPRFAVWGAPTLAAGLAVAVFAAGPLADRFAAQIRPEARADTWPVVATASRKALPLGDGVGSFDRIFRAAEPLDLVGPTFLNHAHNDYLEGWLETGLLGLAILVLFLIWFASRAARAWGPGGSSLARGSSLAVGLLLADSMVDYPLRTETLACLFAFACGCLTPPRPAVETAP
ncbi:MAG TPA: O-antigen ligase family protein [Caulobacteraceae bacterium]|jgi:O-antigen ligase